MPARLYYPNQQPELPPGSRLKPDDSYFVLRLHDSQTILRKNFRWGEAGTLLLKTAIQGDVHEQPIAGVHKVEHFRYNQATRLAAQIDLTDWLPAYGGDSLHLELQYVLVRNQPLRQLLDQMAEADLSAKLTAVKWELGVGVKVAEMFGRAFSYLLREGQAEQIFHLEVDLHVDELQAGFMVAAESSQPAIIPHEFIITERKDLMLKDQFGHPLQDASYVVLEVLPRKRLGERAWRDSAWGEILLEGYREAVCVRAKTENEREQALKKFVEQTCYYVDKVAASDLRFIPGHVDAIMARYERKINKELFGEESYTPVGSTPLHESWQRAFKVKTEAELEAMVENDYQALADSEEWLAFYGIVEA